MSFNNPIASTTNWGVVRVGSGLAVTNGVISTGGTPSVSLNYGFFYDTNNQINTVPDVPNLARFNTTGSNNQISIVGNTQITAANSGTYNVVFTVSLQKTNAGATTVTSIWLRYNGIDISNSRQDIATPNQTSLLFVTGSYTQIMAAGGNIELVWSSPDTAVQFSFLPSTLVPIKPATPSVKITLTRIS